LIIAQGMLDPAPGYSEPYGDTIDTIFWEDGCTITRRRLPRQQSPASL
jgi:hypothetical protein